MRPDKLPDRVEDKVNEADNCPTERQAGDNLQGLYQWNKKVNSLDVPFFFLLHMSKSNNRYSTILYIT